MTENRPISDDEFELYDLVIFVETIDGNCSCKMQVNDRFYLKGGKLSFPEGQDFCLYALQSTLPLLPAKQRQNASADWIETDSRVICPDPACKLIMRIEREKIRTLTHDEVSATPWDSLK